MAYDGTVTIKIDADTKSFDEEIKQTEEYLNKLVSSYEKAANMKGKLKPNEQAMANLRREIEKTNNKLIDLNEKQNKINQGGIPKLKDIFESINKTMDKTITKVSKWVLAIFSVRSAYTAIRSAMSTLSQYNEQLANQINTIRLVFASALEPIVTRLVDLVYRLLTYVNYIAKAWFNVDLFASASAMAMKNGAKNAEKMRKSMAGFDEMNVVTDNSGGSASAGSGFVALASAGL